MAAPTHTREQARRASMRLALVARPSRRALAVAASVSVRSPLCHTSAARQAITCQHQSLPGGRSGTVSGIFISYRRDDSAATVGRIYDRLVETFGKEAIFKDVDSIPLGADFPQYIGGVIQRCTVALIVIGPQWTEARGADGRPRLASSGDFVRLEAETALQRGIPVIPLLVQGAGVPKPEQLPPSMRALVSRNATPIRYDPDFDNDMRRLIHTLASEYRIPARGAFVAPALAGPAPVLMVTLPQSSRRAGIVAAVVTLVLLLTCAGTAVFFGSQLAEIISNITGNLPGGQGPQGAKDQGPKTLLTQFCAAMHAKQYDTAFNDLSTGFKSTVGSADKLPTYLSHPPFTTTILDCSEFGNGGFFRVSGNTAQDTVEFTVQDETGPSHSNGGSTVKFVKENGAWRIDNITG